MGARGRAAVRVHLHGNRFILFYFQDFRKTEVNILERGRSKSRILESLQPTNTSAIFYKDWINFENFN